MTLTSYQTPAVKTLYGGEAHIELAAGKRIKIDKPGSSPVEILDAMVPAGKTWKMTIRIDVEEQDA